MNREPLSPKKFPKFFNTGTNFLFLSLKIKKNVPKKISQVSIIFFLALGLRIIYLSFYVQPEYLIQEDQGMYIALSEKIDLHHWKTWEKATTERTVGYPVFLAFVKNRFGPLFPAVPIIQSFVDSLTCVLIFLTALRLGVNGTIAGVVAALNLNMIVSCGMLLTDCLFIFFLTCFGYLFINSWQRQCLGSGILAIFFLTLATYFRSASYYLIFFALFALGFYFISYKKFRSATVLTLGAVGCFLLVLGPRHYHNWIDFRSPALVTQAGVATLFWYFPGLYQYSGYGSYGEGEKLARQKLKEAMQRDSLADLPQNPYEQQKYLLAVGREAIEELGLPNLARGWITGCVLNLMAPSIAYDPSFRATQHTSFYYTPGKNAMEKIMHYVKVAGSKTYVSLLLFGTITSAAFMCLALWGFVKQLLASPSQRDQLLIWCMGATILYFLLIAGPIISPKYRLPCEPFLTIFAASNLQYLLVSIHKKSRKKETQIQV